MSACGLNENTDDVSKLYICSRHFNENDLIKVDNGARIQLNVDATPCFVKLTSTVNAAINVPLEPQHTSDVEINDFQMSTNIKEANICVTPKRRRFSEPRYISEISTPDLASPRRASRILHFIKKVNQKKSKEIKILQTKNGRLKKRIQTLQNMMRHLQRRGLMSEEAGDALLVSKFNL